MLLFLVMAGNSTLFRFLCSYTRFYFTRPFLCALGMDIANVLKCSVSQCSLDWIDKVEDYIIIDMQA